MPILHSTSQRKVRDGGGHEHSLRPAEALAQNGPLVSVTLSLLKEHTRALTEKGQNISPPIVGLALIDTGASLTCVDKATAEKVGMAIVGTGQMTSATHEKHIVPIFAGLIDIAGFGQIQMLEGFGAALVNQGLIALIGRDVLKHTIFIYNGAAGTISLSG